MRRYVYDYFFLFVVVLVLYGILRILSPFAGPLLGALISAITFYPMYKAVGRWFPKLNPSFHAAIADALVFLLFVTPLILLGWAIVQESTALSEVLKQGSSTVAKWREGNVLEATPWMANVRFFLSNAFGIRHAQFQETFIGWVNSALQYLSLTGKLFAKNVILFILDLSLMLFALFFLFRDGEKFSSYLQNLLPVRREDQKHLTVRFHDALLGIVRGVFLTCLLQGVAATIGYFLVGAEGAALLGALTAIMALVPVLGTFSIWLPAGIFFLLKGSYFKGVFLLAWGTIVVVGLMDTFVRPYLVSKKAEVPLVFLFFAMLGGVEIWGIKGLIWGPLLVAMAPTLLDMYKEHHLGRQEIAASPIPSKQKPAHTMVV